MGRFQPIQLSAQQAMATLASKTGLLGTITSDLASEGYWCVSLDLNVSWDGAAAGEGSMDLYLAHSDWTLVEVEEFIEITTGFDRGDKKGQEVQARGRSIRKVGSLTPEENNLNDGKPTRVKFKIFIPAGNTLNWVFYNNGNALLTTGSFMSWHGKMYGSWAQ